MHRLVSLLVLSLVLVGSVATYAVAQDSPATPTAESDLCASPGAGQAVNPDATPGASPAVGGDATPGSSPVAGDDATPAIQTDGSPEAIATSVAENVVGGLDEVACGTPESTPAA